MKTYDETINTIFSKGDALIEQRRQKSVKIRQTSYAVSGVCAAAIVGVGIWRMNDLKKLPDNRHSEIETVEEMTTTVTRTETYTTTTTTGTEKTKNTTASTSKNTVTSSAKNLTTEKIQITDKTSITISQSTKNTVQASNQTENTTTQTEKSETADTTTMTKSQPDTTLQTSTTYDTITESAKETTRTTTAPNGTIETVTTQFTNDITGKLPSIFNTIILAGTDSLDSKMRDQEFVYTYDLINEDDIDNLLKEIHLNVNYEGNDIERDARIYKIKRFSADALIAVKFEDRDDYFLYCNKLYAPKTLGEFISVFELDADDYTKKCYRGIMDANNISSEELWNIITGYGSLPNVTESCKGKDFRMQEAIWIELTRGVNQSIIFKFGIDPQGYIIAAINTFIPDSYFYIGEEKAAEIIEKYS